MCVCWHFYGISGRRSGPPLHSEQSVHGGRVCESGDQKRREQRGDDLLLASCLLPFLQKRTARVVEHRCGEMTHAHINTHMHTQTHTQTHSRHTLIREEEEEEGKALVRKTAGCVIIPFLHPPPSPIQHSPRFRPPGVTAAAAIGKLQGTATHTGLLTRLIITLVRPAGCLDAWSDECNTSMTKQE